MDSIQVGPCKIKGKKSRKERWTVFRWDPDKTVLSSEAVWLNVFKEKLTEASSLLNQSVESAIKLFTDNLLRATDVMKRSVSFDNIKDRVTNQWFDRECKVKKREIRHALLECKKTNGEEGQHIYVKTKKKSQYKCTVAEEKNNHKRSVHQELFINKQNSRNFWDSVWKARHHAPPPPPKKKPKKQQQQQNNNNNNKQKQKKQQQKTQNKTQTYTHTQKLPVYQNH